MGIARVALVVADYDEAIRFFVDAVGFELVEDSPSVDSAGAAKRWVVVQPPDGGAQLLLAQASGTAQEAVVGNQFGGRVGLFLHVPDFDAAYAGMAAAGVRFENAPRNEAYGRVVIWRDVAGNRWDLIGPAA